MLLVPFPGFPEELGADVSPSPINPVCSTEYLPSGTPLTHTQGNTLPIHAFKAPCINRCIFLLGMYRWLIHKANIRLIWKSHMFIRNTLGTYSVEHTPIHAFKAPCINRSTFLLGMYRWLVYKAYIKLIQKRHMFCSNWGAALQHLPPFLGCHRGVRWDSGGWWMARRCLPADGVALCMTRPLTIWVGPPIVNLFSLYHILNCRVLIGRLWLWALDYLQAWEQSGVFSLPGLPWDAMHGHYGRWCCFVLMLQVVTWCFCDAILNYPM